MQIISEANENLLEEKLRSIKLEITVEMEEKLKKMLGLMMP